MRILVIVLSALLLVCLGGAAFFYVYLYQPMNTEYAGLQSGKSELEKARLELKKYKDQENRDKSWTKPVAEAFTSGLNDEIKNGNAEVSVIGNKVVVNIAEHALYMPGSKTFTKESPQLLLKLESLLKNENLKDKNIYIGNVTQAVSAQGSGKKKIPAKDARLLAADRSMELIKYLEKRNVSQDALVATAYSSKQVDAGFKLKDRKTMIIIENTLTAQLAAKQVPEPQSKQSATASAASSSTSTQQTQSSQTSTIKAASSAPSTTATASQMQPKPTPAKPAQQK